MRVLLTESTARALGARVRAVDPGAEIVALGLDGTLTLDDRVSLDREHTGVEAAWATNDLYEESRLLRPFFGLVRRLDTLVWFQSQAAGYDDPIFGELIRKGVLFTKSDVHRVPIAEYVLRAALDHVQRVTEWRVAQAERSWRRHQLGEIDGSGWVVIGLGPIGLEVARLAQAFGAWVVGVRRHPSRDEPVSEVVTPDRLFTVLPDADVVALCAPANASTAHLVDERFLARMKPGALLVNIARGSLVDEAALLRALDTGPIGAAALDVFETEPLPRDSPLWTHPKVSITPHNSATSTGQLRRQEELFFDNLARLLADEPLRGVVTVADLD